MAYHNGSKRKTDAIPQDARNWVIGSSFYAVRIGFVVL
jgi:hypothetical protein